MTRFNAFWVPCTPEWVSHYNACGTTIRRPVLEPMGDNVYRAVGHEHLMCEPGMTIYPQPVDKSTRPIRTSE